MSDHGRMYQKSMRTLNPSRTEVFTLRRATVREPETGRSSRRSEGLCVFSDPRKKKGASDVDIFFNYSHVKTIGPKSTRSVIQRNGSGI
jgi:hypothetical protein